MSEWYVLIEDKQMGPYSETNLKKLHDSGQLDGGHLVWAEGMENWIRVQDMDLFSSEAPSRSAIAPEKKTWARSFWGDLTLLMKSVPPAGDELSRYISKNSNYWWLVSAGSLPLLFVTVQNVSYQIYLFALYFALIWGFLFKNLVVNVKRFWGPALASMFFTGLIGLFLHKIWFSQFGAIHDGLRAQLLTGNNLGSLFAFLYFAILEELVKAIPVLIAVRFFLPRLSIRQILVIGVFSGLGFAAFENVGYTWGFVHDTTLAGDEYGFEGVLFQVLHSLIGQMLRSVSLCFVHASWTGIVTCFIIFSGLLKVNRYLGVLVSVVIASLLHAFYNWFLGIQPTVSAIIAVVSFSLFVLYTSRILDACTKISDLNPGKIAGEIT